MTARVMLLSVPVLLLAALPAFAEKLFVQVPPKGLPDEGLTVTTSRQTDGTVEFRVSRDVTRARWQGRYAHLDVRGDAGPLVKCQVEPDRRRNTLTYRFTVAAQHLAASRFTLSEVQTDGRGPDAIQLVGGGTIYEFRLVDFVNSSARR